MAFRFSKRKQAGWMLEFDVIPVNYVGRIVLQRDIPYSVAAQIRATSKKVMTEQGVVVQVWERDLSLARLFQAMDGDT